MYRALRVPVALLQQKVFSTSHRLEEFKKLETPVVRAFGPFDHGSQVARSMSIPKAFWENSQLRRAFYSISNHDENALACRACNVQTHSLMERSDHAKCFGIIHATLQKMIEDGQCAVCTTRIEPQSHWVNVYRIPICSDSCCRTWERWVPMAFRQAMEGIREQLKKNGVE